VEARWAREAPGLEMEARAARSPKAGPEGLLEPTGRPEGAPEEPEGRSRAEVPPRRQEDPDREAEARRAVESVVVAVAAPCPPGPVARLELRPAAVQPPLEVGGEPAVVARGSVASPGPRAAGEWEAPAHLAPVRGCVRTQARSP
jgi:hypothetical protein